MEKSTTNLKNEKQAQRSPPPQLPKNKKSSTQKNQGPTKATGRAEHTPDGTIEQNPEEQAP